MSGVQKIKTITFISPHKSRHAVVKEMLADLLFVILNTEKSLSFWMLSRITITTGSV